MNSSAADSQNQIVLLVEDNPGDARLMREYLLDDAAAHFEIEHASRLSEAVSILAACHSNGHPIAVVLLDLSLPDAQGLETFAHLHREAPNVPIVVLTGLDDDETAMHAVGQGAQDYLVKGQVTTPLLVRALRYAVQRQRMRDELEKLSTVDELTDLLNRRGFLMMAAQHLKIARRKAFGQDEPSPLVMFFIDLDGMKQINDGFGHAMGDWALQQAAAVLRRTFRETDVTARLGGDEFTVLAELRHEDDTEILLARIQTNVQAVNDESCHSFKLGLTVGLACFDPREVDSIDQMLAHADSVLYEQKRNRPRSNAPI